MNNVFGGGQGRAAGNLETDTQIAGMHMAKVVLPSPGGPSKRMCPNGSPRLEAASTAICTRAYTSRCPTMSCIRCGAQIAVVVLEIRRWLQDRFPGHNVPVYRRGGRGTRGTQTGPFSPATCGRWRRSALGGTELSNGTVSDILRREYNCNMATPVDKIVSEALELPPPVRAFVAEKLIESLDAASGADLSRSGEKRFAAVRTARHGAVELHDAESVFARAYSRWHEYGAIPCRCGSRDG